MPNLGYAYDAPSVVTPELIKDVYGDPMQQYRQQQFDLQKQKQADLDNQRHLQNQDKAVKFVNDNTKPFDPTKDPAADVVNGQLGDVRTKYSKMIHDNPNLDEAELESNMQDDLNKINLTANNIRTGAARIKESVGGWGKVAGANTLNLEQNARDRMMYDTDANGKKTLKTDINPNADYVGDEIHENSSKYVNGDAALDAVFKQENENRSPINDVERADKAGVKIQSGMKGTIAPYQHAVYDANGKITGVATNAINATDEQGKPIVDPNTKQPMQIVDDNTFQKFNTPGMAIRLKGEVDDMLKGAGIDPKNVDPTSKTYQTFVKHAMLLAIDKNAKKDITPVDNQSNSAAKDKQEMTGYNILGKALSKSEENKEDKLTGSNYGKLIDAFNGDKTILNAGTQVNVNGRNFIDVTDAVGGFSTNADKKEGAHNPEFNKVGRLLIDPINPGHLYTIEHDYNEVLAAKKANENDSGHLQVYDGKDLENIMRRHAPNNGMDNSNDLNKLFKLKPISQTQPSKETNLDKYKKKVGQIIGGNIPNTIQ